MSIILNGLKGADLIIYNILQENNRISIHRISCLTTYNRCTVWRSINYLRSLGLIDHKTANKKLC